MATIAKSILTPNWEKEIKNSLTVADYGFLESATKIEISLLALSALPMRDFPKFVNVPEIAKASVSYISAERKGDFQFFVTDEAMPDGKGYWVEFETTEDELADVCEACGLLVSEREYNTRLKNDEAEGLATTLAGVFDSRTTHAESHLLCVCYLIRYGTQHIATCREETVEDFMAFEKLAI